MMLWQALAAARDLGRLHEIASVLVRYGFGDIVRRMGLANALERAGRALHWNDAEEVAHLPPPARVRRVMEELGPTFVKLGQVLATRVDLFEPEWIAEFGKLQDHAPAVPYAEIRAQLIEDLGAPPEEVFVAFDPVPLAAASIAQVYRARLHDGTEVAIKVRRPGIGPVIEADLRWLAKLAELAEAESAELRSFRPREVARQFAQSLRRELDLASECRSAERIAENFMGYTDEDVPPATGDVGTDSGAATASPGASAASARSNGNHASDEKANADARAAAAGAAPASSTQASPTPNPRAHARANPAARAPGRTSPPAPPVPPAALPIIVIPRIHWDWVSERLCVQDFIDGIPASQLAAVDAAGLDRRVLARRGAHAVLKMVVEDGFFHADPHPGNVFYLPGNRLALIDFGMMGRLTETRREQLITVMLGLVRDAPRQVVDVLLEWAGDTKVDEEGLLLEIQRFIDQYRGAPLKRLSLSAMLGDLVAILRQNQLALPADLALLIKAFITLEGLGRALDPDFNMAGTALPMLEQVMHERYTPRALLKRGWRSAGEILALLGALPGDFSRLLRAARRGNLEIRIEVPSMKRVGNQIDRAANRLTIGIVVAALIIGSSIVMTVPGGPKLFGLPVFGLIGFLGAALGGAWLLLSIWRTRHEE